MKLRLSLTQRLTGFYLLVSSVLLLGMAGFIASAISTHFAELDRDTLNDKIDLVRGITRHNPLPENWRATLDAALQNHPGLHMQIKDPQGRLLYTNANSPLATQHGSQTAFRSLSAPLSGTALAPSGTIFATLDTVHHAHFESGLRHSLWLYVLVGAGFSGLLGWWAAHTGLAPLRRMQAQARQITARKLDRRMEMAALPVELSELAATLNDMLQRLQDDFERLNDFSSDLAHELRTPLNNLLTQTEVVLSRSRALDTYRDTLASNREELQRLSRMVSDMLWLARTEHGALNPADLKDIDLAHEVTALFDFYEALAEDRGVRLVLLGNASVRGNGLMLRRAISNLLSNALRHAPQNSDIVVRIDTLAGTAVRIGVLNQGLPIPPDTLPRLFDRFFRADKSRLHLDSDGAGLGLSITQAIAQAHGGHAHAVSKDGLNQFYIDLPNTGPHQRSKS